MKSKNSRIALIGALLCALLGLISPAMAAKDQPYMEMALDYLQEAAAPAPQRSPLDPPVIIDRAGLLKSAKAALQKAPSIYKGRRAKAMEFVNFALEQLKADKEQAAISATNKAISEVRDGIRLGR